MLLALVSTIDSMTSLPPLLRTVITTASLCTFMPIYLMSRLMQLPPWGKIIRANAYLLPRYSAIPLADLPTPPLLFFLTAPTYSLAAGAERNPAQRSGAQAAAIHSPPSIGALFHNALTGLSKRESSV